MATTLVMHTEREEIFFFFSENTLGIPPPFFIFLSPTFFCDLDFFQHPKTNNV